MASFGETDSDPVILPQLQIKDSPNTKTELETAFIRPDCSTASLLFASILYNVCLFLPYLSKTVLHICHPLQG